MLQLRICFLSSVITENGI